MFSKPFDRHRAETIGCSGCVFFEPDSSSEARISAFEDERGLNRKLNPLGVEYGECRRRAPGSQSATNLALAEVILNLFEKLTAQALSADERRSVLSEFETYSGIYSFPYARTYNWCGEFVER